MRTLLLGRGQIPSPLRRHRHPPEATLDAMTKPIRLGLAAVFAALSGLTGCHSGPHSTPSASPTGLSEAQILTVLQDYTQCMHDHGVPSFEQPRYDNGRVHGGGAPPGVSDDQMKAAGDACDAIARRLPDTAWGRQELTAAQIDKLRQWSACLRQHGIPDWPDPDSRGRFPVVGTPLENALKGSKDQGDTAHQALDACKQYSDGGALRMTTP
jgi:hypothetical protein